MKRNEKITGTGAANQMKINNLVRVYAFNVTHSAFTQNDLAGGRRVSLFPALSEPCLSTAGGVYPLNELAGNGESVRRRGRGRLPSSMAPSVDERVFEPQLQKYPYCVWVTRWHLGTVWPSEWATWMPFWESLTVVLENVIKACGGEVANQQILKHIKDLLSSFC